MVRAIIFDCFGVVITDALKVVVQEVEVTNPQGARQIVDAIHANNRGLIDPAELNQQIAEVLGISVAAFRQRIQQGEVKDERLLAYVRELRKKYKTAMLSNIGRQSLQRRFDEGELKAHFDVVVTSGDVGMVKPEPEIYQLVARELGVTPNECVMVDDREHHCAGAEAVGMHSILYQSFGQARRDLEKYLLAEQAA